MGKKYQGIFLFDDWLEALNRMSPRMAMTIINNVYGYSVYGVEPERLRGSADLVQNLMLAHERRSRQAAIWGRRGAEARWASSEEDLPSWEEENGL